MLRYAIGFRDHTGWAAAVLLERGEPRPAVRASRRFDLCPPDLPNEVYHAAASLDREAGKALVAAVRDTVRDMAYEQVTGLLAEFGVQPAATVAGVPMSSGRIVESVTAVTKMHAMMHAAEGHLYREALAEACESAGITARRYPSKQLGELAATQLVTTDGLAEALAAMGAGFGPPWTRDQKDAVTVGWLALAASPP